MRAITKLFNLYSFWYADDTTLAADSEEKLQKIVNKVKEQSENLGLYMNVSDKNDDGKQSGEREEYSNRCQWSRIRTSKGL